MDRLGLRYRLSISKHNGKACILEDLRGGPIHTAVAKSLIKTGLVVAIDEDKNWKHYIVPCTN